MPADSDPVALPHTWRPFGVRMAGLVLGLGLALIVVLAWLGFDAETQQRFSWLQRGTVLAIGLLGGLLGYALMRSRVVARSDRLVVVNGYRRREYDYAEVVSVHLPPGAPWATLDLSDGSTVAAMGIQGSDGSRARRSARELRSVVEQQSS
ncbi:MAG: PH domain-containing protein [Nocardioides sp.]